MLNICRLFPTVKIGINHNCVHVNTQIWFIRYYLAKVEKEPKTPLGARLRGIRKKLNDVEREKFAQSLGISKNTLAYYERGERTPDADVLERYRLIFGIDINWLLTGEGNMFTNAATAPTSLRIIDTNVLAEISGAVDDVYRSLGQHPSKKLITSVSADIYNAMLTADEPTDFADAEMLRADIAAYMARLKKRIINGKDTSNKATA